MTSTQPLTYREFVSEATTRFNHRTAATLVCEASYHSGPTRTWDQWYDLATREWMSAGTQAHTSSSGEPAQWLQDADTDQDRADLIAHAQRTAADEDTDTDAAGS